MTLNGATIFTASYAEDPYPSLARIRDRGAVCKIVQPDGWLVTSHAECAKVLVDDAHFSADPAAATSTSLGAEVQAHRSRSPLGMTALLGSSDGESHRRLRRLVAPYFGSGPLSLLRDEVDAIVAGSLERTHGGQLDLVMQVIRPTVEQAAGTLVGLIDREPRLWQASRALMAAHAGAAVRATSEYRTLRRHLQRGRDAGRDGSLLSGLGQSFCDGDLEETAAVALLAFILNAGVSPTTLAVGNTLHAFATHQDQLAALRHDPERIARAVDEALRFDSPTQVLLRHATSGVELGGQTLAKGDTVFVMIGAAHHDPTEFEDPDSFDLSRSLQAHQILSFGRGPHFCLGAPLARVLIEGFIELLVLPDTFPRLATKWERGGDFLTRGFHRIMVRRP